jgi:quercetin dioxygenase-like cupin family protein
MVNSVFAVADEHPRRIVTGLRPDGISYFAVNEQMEPEEPPFGGLEVYEAWNAELPFELPDGEERQAPVTGSVQVFIVRYFPGQSLGRPFANVHWHDTVDVQILISGELVQRLDDGSEVTMRPGDVIIQNGTSHAWEARGEQEALLALVMHSATRVGVAPPDEQNAARVLQP